VVHQHQRHARQRHDEEHQEAEAAEAEGVEEPELRTRHARWVDVEEDVGEHDPHPVARVPRQAVAEDGPPVP
jgi:hypothetical protein